MARNSMYITVDRRSLRSFSKQVTALANVVSEDMTNAAVEFAENVLAASNELIPVDTGTAASSAGYTIEPAYNGVRVRFGYAVSNNPTNPRTGESASTYVNILHEDLSVPHSNGQAKFLETALYNRTELFSSYGHARLGARLAGATVDTGRSTPVKHTDYLSSALNRISAGYTATHNKGKYLPFPGRAL